MSVSVYLLLATEIKTGGNRLAFITGTRLADNIFCVHIKPLLTTVIFCGFRLVQTCCHFLAGQVFKMTWLVKALSIIHLLNELIIGSICRVS